MRRGFKYNQNRCVDCRACSAACVLENNWDVKPRMVYVFNNEVNTALPLINLSLACNHCETPVCLEGCPSGAYFRDLTTGAIVINDQNCVGCKYCKWNCPYDAPKFDLEKKVIGKCNLCYESLIEGRMPACTYACPTGALSYGDISEKIDENVPAWFPDKGINPAIKFTGKLNLIPLRIVPQNNFESTMRLPKPETRFKSSLVSLLGFSFLSTISVSLLISSATNGLFPDTVLISVITILAAVSSLFHLGKVTRAWRAILNIKSSPLSHEIALLVLYSVSSISAAFFEIPILLIISSILGLLFLLAIDNVYYFPLKPKPPVIHSGQTFLSSLLIISFLSVSIIPFIFIASVKIVLLIVKALSAGTFSLLRTIRLSLLAIAAASIIHYSSLSSVTIAIFLSGELLDRMLFYIDFDQLNIKSSIKNYITSYTNEKERGK